MLNLLYKYLISKPSCSVLFLLLTCCAGGIYVPLFDGEAVLGRYPKLKDVIVMAENYVEKEKQDEIWVIDDERVIDAGVKLKLEIIGYDDMASVYLIPSNGVISIKYIRDVSVRGKTLRDLRDEVEKKLKEYLLNPQVVLSVMGYATRESSGTVTVLGRVEKSGRYELSMPNPYLKNNTPQTLFVLIVKAGRKSDSALTQVMVIRKRDNNYKVIVCDLVKFNVMGDMAQNIILRDGDIIIVPVIYGEKEQSARELEYIEAYINGKIGIDGLTRELGNK